MMITGGAGVVVIGCTHGSDSVMSDGGETCVGEYAQRLFENLPENLPEELPESG
jgi:hypothetical protein